MEQILEKIKAFADRCHGDQMRKYSDERYIVHPERVMQICKQYTNDITMLAAALLHDVLEDTPVSEQEIRQFLSPLLSEEQVARTLELVEELTDVYVKARYPQWNRRKRKQKETARLKNSSAAAQTIKYADIMDNAPEIAAKDPDFARRFLFEARDLLKAMDKGDPRLYKQAQEAVNKCLQPRFLRERHEANNRSHKQS
jgi:(p)ppGpp synthase/HD superfamily hydrolase